MLDGRRSRYDHGEYSCRYGFNLDDDGFNRDDPRNRSAYLYVKSPRRFPIIPPTKIPCSAQARRPVTLGKGTFFYDTSPQNPPARGSERHRLVATTIVVHNSAFYNPVHLC